MGIHPESDANLGPDPKGGSCWTAGWLLSLEMTQGFYETKGWLPVERGRVAHILSRHTHALTRPHISPLQIPVSVVVGIEKKKEKKQSEVGYILIQNSV